MTQIDEQSAKTFSPLEGQIWAKGGIMVLGKFTFIVMFNTDIVINVILNYFYDE